MEGGTRVTFLLKCDYSSILSVGFGLTNKGHNESYLWSQPHENTSRQCAVRFISQDIKLITTQHGFYSLNNFSHEFSQRRGGKKKKKLITRKKKKKKNIKKKNNTIIKNKKILIK